LARRSTGKYLAQQMLEAADRASGARAGRRHGCAREERGFAALAAHPNIEVRVFNPFASRSGKLRKVGEGARNFKRINRRMHNKTGWPTTVSRSWWAESRDEILRRERCGEFRRSGFRNDRPVVRDVSASFDRYWNSPSPIRWKCSMPMRSMHRPSKNCASV